MWSSGLCLVIPTDTELKPAEADTLMEQEQEEEHTDDAWVVFILCHYIYFFVVCRHHVHKLYIFFAYKAAYLMQVILYTFDWCASQSI